MAINFSSLKVGYTQGDAFNYNDAAYTGYYTVLSGTPYRGKLTTIDILSNQDNYTNNVLVSDYLFDRTLVDNVSLDYTIEDFTIPNGEFITSTNLNKYFERFHQNTNYLYSRLFMYDSNLPRNVTAVVGVTGTDDSLRFYTDLDNFTPGSFTTNSQVSSYNFGNVQTIAYKVNPDTGNFALFTATSSSLIALTGNIGNLTQNLTSVGVSLSTSLVNQQPDDLTFLKIVDMEIIDDFLFVLDKDRNSLVKYNIYNFYSGDQSNPSPKVTVEIKSGGGKFLPSSFNYPDFMTTTGNSVIIYQNTDRFFKQYDTSLNLINFGRVFRRQNEEVISIGYNKIFNLVACIVKVNDVYSFYYLDNTFNIIEKYRFGINLTQGEFIKKLMFSENDSNIFYITTNKFIYKMMVNKPDKIVGLFSDNRLKIIGDSGDYLGTTLVGASNNYDTIILVKNNRFMFLNEPNTFTDVLKTKDFSNYPISQIKLDKEEYLQANYINKELYKIFENIIRIKNQVIGSFYGKYELTNQQLTYEDSLYSPSLVLKGINYFLNYDFLNITNDNDFFVHENEPINNMVLNRCFNNLYKLQESILLSTKIANTSLVPYLTTDSVLYLN
jgi:hypothetical protein